MSGGPAREGFTRMASRAQAAASRVSFPLRAQGATLVPLPAGRAGRPPPPPPPPPRPARQATAVEAAAVAGAETPGPPPTPPGPPPPHGPPPPGPPASPAVGSSRMCAKPSRGLRLRSHLAAHAQPSAASVSRARKMEMAHRRGTDKLLTGSPRGADSEEITTQTKTPIQNRYQDRPE